MKARVAEEHKTNYVIWDKDKEFLATVRGAFFTEQTFPKVGDYVEYTELTDGKAVIEEVLPRTTAVVRKSAHTGEPQTIVANVDTIFIVMGLDDDFNLNRLERYLLLAEQSNVRSVVVLNKADKVQDAGDYIKKVKDVAGSSLVFAVSAKTGDGMEKLFTQIQNDETVVLLGSSGAGKSTITNWLLQADKQSVRGVREDDSRGRHTTTSRQMFELPSGGYLIDTPGMRELGLIDGSDEDENTVFELIEELSTQCQFRNCDHEKSKGCAVLKAIESNELTERQLQNYHKLKRERQFEESKNDPELAYQERKRKRELHKGYDKFIKQKKFQRDL
ncbi:ribosome small subunit-dependent GTPase A [Candidatus Kaiserbacteria bacterium]|nr:ribosome small subunit-dependent GTPase A [Candidatus Kaiserbacteria bacterium]